jgi:hypothetical protein
VQGTRARTIPDYVIIEWARPCATHPASHDMWVILRASSVLVVGLLLGVL